MINRNILAALILSGSLAFSQKMLAQSQQDPQAGKPEAEYSDPSADRIREEIDQSIWKVFKESFEGGDWKTFNGIHSDDVLRISDRGIRNG